MGNWLGHLLLLGSWLQPLHVGPWVSWHNEILAFLAMLWFGSASLLSRQRISTILPIHWQVIAIFPLLFSIVWLQYAVGLIEFRGDAFIVSAYLGLLAFAVLTGMFWCHADQLEKGGRLAGLATTMLVGAFLSVVVALIQVFDVWGLYEWVTTIKGYRRPGSNLAQANHFGTLAIMGLVSLFYLQQRKAIGNTPTWLIGSVLCLGVAMSESRTALVSMLVVLLWWMWNYRQFVGWIGKCGLGGSVLIYLSLLWLWPVFITALQLEQGGVVSERTVSQLGNIGIRQIVWAQLWEAVLERFWLGWGFLGVTEAISAVASRHEISEVFTYSHNIVLDFCIWMGVPLTLGVLLLAVWWGWTRLRSISSLEGWYCWALFAPVLVHAMLEFPHAYAYFLVPVGLAVGYQEIREKKQAGSMCIDRRILIALISGFFVLLAWSEIEYLKIEEDYRVVRFEDLRVGITPEMYVRPEPVLFTQLGAMLDAGRTEPRPGMAASELDHLHDVATRYMWPVLQNRYALALALNKDEAGATLALKSIRAMHGPDQYEKIRAYWKRMADERYPELRDFALP